MSINKILQFFLIASSCMFNGFFEVAFASSSSSSGAVEANVFKCLNRRCARDVEVDISSSICRGIAKVITRKKIVALTFDDGPHQKHTREILEILKKNDIRATFFFIGENVAKLPDIVKETYLTGNTVSNHSYSHFYLNRLSKHEIENELIKTSQLIDKMIGKYPVLFRPPYGVCSNNAVKTLNELGFTSIAWSDITNDYDIDQTTHEKIANEIIRQVGPGVIIALHDGGGNREKTVKALPTIISALKEKGYEFLTIPEMLDIDAYSG